MNRYCHLCAGEALKLSQMDAINQAWDSQKHEMRRDVVVKYRAFTWDPAACPHITQLAGESQVNLPARCDK
jgi:hypothetical protein